MLWGLTICKYLGKNSFIYCLEDLCLEATRGFRQSWKYKAKKLADEFQPGNLLGETEYTSYLNWKFIQQYIVLKLMLFVLFYSDETSWH